MGGNERVSGFDRVFESTGASQVVENALAAMGAVAYADTVSQVGSALTKSWMSATGFESVTSRLSSMVSVDNLIGPDVLERFTGTIGAVAAERVRLSAFGGLAIPSGAVAEALASMHGGAFAFTNSALGAGRLTAQLPTLRGFDFDALMPRSDLVSFLTSTTSRFKTDGADLSSAYSARYRQLAFDESRVERAATALAEVDRVITSSTDLETTLDAAYVSTRSRGSFGPDPTALAPPLEAAEAVLLDSPSLRSELSGPLEEVLHASDLDAPALRDQFDRIGLRRNELISSETANAWGLFAGTTLGTLVAVGLNGIDGFTAAAVWEAFGSGAAAYGTVRYRLRPAKKD